MEKMTLSIPTIGCAGCVDTIRRVLTKTPGVLAVEGDPKIKVITVVRTEGTARDEELIHSLRKRALNIGVDQRRRPGGLSVQRAHHHAERRRDVLRSRGHVGDVCPVRALDGDAVAARYLGRAAGAVQLGAPKARVVRDGKVIEVPTSEIRKGDTVELRPGDRVPVDGQVTEGETAIDESLVTGESIPVTKRPGDQVTDGTINQSGSGRRQRSVARRRSSWSLGCRRSRSSLGCSPANVATDSTLGWDWTRLRKVAAAISSEETAGKDQFCHVIETQKSLQALGRENAAGRESRGPAP